MSGANSIHGVVLIGAMVITAAVSSTYALALAAVAMAFAAMNVVGGYLVTDRMLQMFLRRPQHRRCTVASTMTCTVTRRRRRDERRFVHHQPDLPARRGRCFVLGLHLMNSPAPRGAAT